jgi:hypothetical protein
VADMVVQVYDCSGENTDDDSEHWCVIGPMIPEPLEDTRITKPYSHVTMDRI